MSPGLVPRLAGVCARLIIYYDACACTWISASSAPDGQPTGRFWPTNLTDAILESADLFSVDLEGCNLNSTDLRGANLTQANLKSVDLSVAIIDDETLGVAEPAEAALAEQESD